MSPDERKAELDKAREKVKAAGGPWLSDFFMQYQKQHDMLAAKYGDDFDKPSSSGMFGVNKAEAGVIAEWLDSLLPEILAIQNKGRSVTSDDDMIMSDTPYYGATGGGVKYQFTPTSLGTILVVTEAITGKALNVTDALGWYFYG